MHDGSGYGVDLAYISVYMQRLPLYLLNNATRSIERDMFRNAAVVWRVQISLIAIKNSPHASSHLLSYDKFPVSRCLMRAVSLIYLEHSTTAS
jgi:hypothetical protein